jgi:hypothetical protein
MIGLRPLQEDPQGVAGQPPGLPRQRALHCADRHRQPRRDLPGRKPTRCGVTLTLPFHVALGPDLMGDWCGVNTPPLSFGLRARFDS